jgi:SAM-dependent methyltransferase
VPCSGASQDLFSILCQIGQVSRALAPYVGRLVGVDISPRMVEQYNARADAQGLEPHEMRAVCTLAELDAQDRFDLIVVRAPLLVHSLPH